MKSTKKIGVLCCLLALLLLVLTACGTKKPADTTGTATKEAQTTTEDDDFIDDFIDDDGEIPEPIANYEEDGSPTEFRLGTRANRYHYLFCDDATTSDTVEYATFQRNARIEEKYGIVFKNVQIAGNKGTEWSTILESGSDEIDLMCWDYWWALEQKGYFVDLQTMSELNLDSDWYYAGWNDNVTINGISYSCVGDAALEVLENIEVMFFNKGIAAANELDLYGLVNDGEWTLEKAYEVIRDVAQGVDNEDESDDLYGAIYDKHSVRCGLFSAGLKLVTVSQDNGAIAITLNTQRNVNICDAFTEYVHDPAVYYVDTTARNFGDKVTKFVGGKSLFYATALYCGKQIKNTMDDSFEYGILLMPKYDAESEYVGASYGASVFSIPKSARNREMSAVILEVMNRYSNETIVTAFYENTLKRKIADSPDDATMIDTARDLLYMDFAFVCESSSTFNPFTKIANEVMKNGSVSSIIASITTSAKSQLQNLLEVYQ